MDNNVAISALIIENSISHKAYRKAVEKHILFISEEVIFELITRLKWQKFSRYFVNEIIREELILAYLELVRKLKSTIGSAHAEILMMISILNWRYLQNQT